MSNFILKILFLFLFFSYTGLAQRQQINTQRDSLEKGSLNDSLRVPQDTLNKRSSSLDTIVVYSAEDSVVFDVKQKSMRLKGKGKINMGAQKLNAEVITIDFDNSILNAHGIEDSLGRITGFPKFNDRGEEFAGEKIRYNYKTNKGNISLGETQMEEGFYYGEKIKRVGQTALYVKDGRYTTCDPPNDDYYFGSPKMKVLVKNKIFLDPLVLYVQDMPIFYLPIGIFLPNKSGRRSGIIIPGYYFSRSRGVAFDGLGFYWAASQYWDTQITSDIYSKGGYLIESTTRWNKKYSFNGTLDMSYGRSRSGLDQDWRQNYKFRLNHAHDLSPTDNIRTSLNFASSDYNRNTSFNTRERITQNIYSNASYQTTFDNGNSFNIGYTRNQNIIDDSYDQSLSANYRIQNQRPLANVNSLPEWVRDFSFSYGVNGRYSDDKDLDIRTLNYDNNPDSTYRDTSFEYSTSRRIEHRPSISISPKFSYFTFRPSLSFSLNNYFRRINRFMDPVDSTIVDEVQQGLFTEYNYRVSFSTSTKLYGMFTEKQRLLGFIKPKMLGIEAGRHIFSPNISLSFSPDLSDPNNGFYGSYYDYKQEKMRQYSKYALDGGGLASKNESLSLNYSDNHTFEVKIPQGDTLEAKNLKLLNMNFSTNYDFNKDSLKLSDVTMSFNSPVLDFLDFSGSSTFRLYDEKLVTYYDEQNEEYEQEFRTIDELRILNGNGLARMTRFNISLRTSFSSEGISLNRRGSETRAQDTTQKDAKEKEDILGKRFKVGDTQRRDLDFFGQHHPGYAPLNVPWEVSLGLQYDYNRSNMSSRFKSENLYLNFSGRLSLTNSWEIRINSGYDILEQELRAPIISLNKTIGCDWELQVDWTPTGINRGFYAKFGISVQQLQDLKIEKRNNPLTR